MKVLDYMSTGWGRVIRGILGVVMMMNGAVLGGGWWALAVFGLLPLATGIFNVCPISPLFGRSWRGNACRPPLSGAD